MTGMVEVRRVAGFTESDTAEPPVWWAGKDTFGNRCVLLTCGGCGVAVHLSGWTVADDGTVSPSVWHNEPQCGWHVFIRLLDWDPE